MDGCWRIKKKDILTFDFDLIWLLVKIEFIDGHYLLINKMKNGKYHTVGTVLKSNRKFLERGKFDAQTHKHITAHCHMYFNVI